MPKLKYIERMEGSLETTKRLLIVEDEQVVADFVARVLRKEGFAVDVATNGEIAQNFLGNDYDLILIDIRMPLMNGKRLYEYIKLVRPELVSSVVFTSGELVDASTLNFLSMEGRLFLHKPFGIEDLRAVVEKTLQKNRIA